MLVARFVLIFDAIEEVEIGNLALFVTPDFVAVQRTYFMALDIIPILAPVFKLLLALVGREVFPKPQRQRVKNSWSPSSLETIDFSCLFSALESSAAFDRSGRFRSASPTIANPRL